MQSIGCDIDGVLADFGRGYLDLLSSITGREADPAFVPSCYDDFEVPPEAEMVAWAWITAHPEFWLTLPAYPSTGGLLSALDDARSDHEVYFVTGRPKSAATKRFTEEWLRQQGATDPTVLLAVEKGSVAAGLQLGLMIEDCPVQVQSIRVQSPMTHLIVAAWSYNQEVDTVRVPVEEVEALLRAVVHRRRRRGQ